MAEKNIPESSEESKAAFAATLHTHDYRGDHSADVQIALEVRDGETVADLISRVLDGPRLLNHPDRQSDAEHYMSFITLRLVWPGRVEKSDV